MQCHVDACEDMQPPELVSAFVLLTGLIVDFLRKPIKVVK